MDILDVISGIKTAHKLDDDGVWADMTTNNDDLSENGTVVNTVGHSGTVSSAALFSNSSLTSSLSLIGSPSNIGGFGNTLFLMAWVKLATTGTSQNIISKWGGGQSSYRLYYDGTDFVFELSANGTTAFASVSSRLVLVTGSWYPIICTYDQVEARLHIGKFIEGRAAATSALLSSTATYTVGDASSGDMSIDDIAVGITVPTEDILTNTVLATDDHQYPPTNKTDEIFIDSLDIQSATNNVQNKMRPKKLGVILDLGSAGSHDAKRISFPVYHNLGEGQHALLYVGLEDDSVATRNHKVCIATASDVEGTWTKPNLATGNVFGISRSVNIPHMTRTLGETPNNDGGSNNIIAAEPEPDMTNCQGMWFLDETTGNRVDRSGNSYDLTATGSPGSGRGYHDTNQPALIRDLAADFSGGGYLSRTHASAANLDITGNLSVVLKFYNTAAATNRYLVCKDDRSTQRSWAVYITASNQIIFSVFGAISGQVFVGSTYPMAAGWYTICGRYDVSAGLLRLQYNGVDATPVAFTDGAILSSTAAITIGVASDGASLPHDERINDVAVFDAAISDARVTDLAQRADMFTPTRSRFSPSLIEDGGNYYMGANIGSDAKIGTDSNISGSGWLVGPSTDIVNFQEKTETKLWTLETLAPVIPTVSDCFLTSIIKDPQDAYRPYKVMTQYSKDVAGNVARRCGVFSSKAIGGPYELDTFSDGGIDGLSGGDLGARVYTPQYPQIHGVQGIYLPNSKRISGVLQVWLLTTGEGILDIDLVSTRDGYTYVEDAATEHHTVEAGRQDVDDDMSLFSGNGPVHISEAGKEGTYIFYSGSDDSQNAASLSVAFRMYLAKWGYQRIKARCHSLWRGNIALWDMSDATDRSGYGNVLVASTSAPTFVAGHAGTAATASHFTRASNQYYTLPFANLWGFPVVNTFTVAGWFYLDSLGIWQTIIQQDVLNDYGFLVQITTANKLNFSVTQDGNYLSAVTASSTTTFTSGTWYHFAGVLDGVNVKLYINGSNEANSAYVKDLTTRPYLTWGSHADIFIGSSGSGSNLLDGRIDDVGIWARALTAGEIGNPSTPDTLAYNTGTDDFNITTDSDFITKELLGPIPNLVINAQGNMGDIKIAVLDPATDTPFAGFDVSDFTPFTGDSLEHNASWSGGSLSSLGNVKLKFVQTKNSQIYRYQALASNRLSKLLVRRKKTIL